MTCFLDANVAIHALGNDGNAAPPCQEILNLGEAHPGACRTSAEVFQEVLHVLGRQQLRSRLAVTLRLLDGATGRNAASLLRSDVLRAATADLPPNLQARDRVHLAVMARLGITSIISTDRAFDGIPGITRLDPLTLDSWRDTVFTATP
ncbi:MAG: hypothetical protein C0506_13635 [Anaerolinea sp.]|nr:hypothetical protein [Anaerolinea sp.]